MGNTCVVCNRKGKLVDHYVQYPPWSQKKIKIKQHLHCNHVCGCGVIYERENAHEWNFSQRPVHICNTFICENCNEPINKKPYTYQFDKLYNKKYYHVSSCSE